MKSWTQFLLCLVLAGCIWLIHNLTSRYSEIVNVHVVAVSELEGRANASSGPALVAARCSASGFRLVALNRAAKRGKTVSVEIPSEKFQHVKGDVFSISSSELNLYTSAIFGDDVKVESFISSNVEFSFKPMTYRKVPVVVVQDVTFKPQYMANGSLVLSPDSVLVYGEPASLARIDRVKTETLTLSDVASTAHGVLHLQEPRGLRLSTTDVAYTLNVSRYVQISAEVNVTVRNAPAGRYLSLHPSKVMMRARCAFPSSVSASDIKAYVDYREFVNSRTGRCLVRADRLPEGVIDCSFSPEVCECVEIR